MTTEQADTPQHTTDADEQLAFLALLEQQGTDVPESVRARLMGGRHFGTSRPPSPWIPVGDRVLVAKLLKLAEEANELSKACVRAAMQGGMCMRDPETGETNETAILKETADVTAGIFIINDVVPGILGEEWYERITAKTCHLRGWHRLIVEHSEHEVRTAHRQAHPVRSFFRRVLGKSC